MVRSIFPILVLVVVSLGAAAPVFSVENTQDLIGVKAVWPTEWTPLSAANDPDDGYSTQVDIVGNETYPAGYFARDDDYIYFRMRLNYAGTVSASDGNPPFSDAHLVVIDVEGFHWEAAGTDPAGQLVAGDDDYPDYSFAWDSGLDPSRHGLEMQVRDAFSEKWADIRMDDLDGSSGQKGDTDINGDSRTTDGYVRTIDSVETDTVANGGFDNTTFMDFAVSWSYLETYTDLSAGQVWNVTFATIENNNDHGAFKDVAGAIADLNQASVTSGWSGVTPTEALPLPPTLLLLLAGLGLLTVVRCFERRSSRPASAQHRLDFSAPALA